MTKKGRQFFFGRVTLSIAATGDTNPSDATACYRQVYYSFSGGLIAKILRSAPAPPLRFYRLREYLSLLILKPVIQYRYRPRYIANIDNRPMAARQSRPSPYTYEPVKTLIRLLISVHDRVAEISSLRRVVRRAVSLLMSRSVRLT